MAHDLRLHLSEEASILALSKQCPRLILGLPTPRMASLLLEGKIDMLTSQSTSNQEENCIANSMLQTLEVADNRLHRMT